MFSDPPFPLQPGSGPIVTGLSRFPCYKNKKEKDIPFQIKKENIGLIEVMGLAILPPRLKEELKQVQDYLLGRESTVATYHQAWADDLKATHPAITEEAEAEALVRESVGQIFARVLEDAGVYKRTAEGQAAFRRFVATL